MRYILGSHAILKHKLSPQCLYPCTSYTHCAEAITSDSSFSHEQVREYPSQKSLRHSFQLHSIGQLNWATKSRSNSSSLGFTISQESSLLLVPTLARELSVPALAELGKNTNIFPFTPSLQLRYNNTIGQSPEHELHTRNPLTPATSQNVA